jgi:sugar O-acyltransferase (sialic acid O-acetyltransferase NeuD family)
MKSLVLIGGGGHCRSCIDVIESHGAYKIAGIIDNDSRKTDTNLNIPYLGTDEELARILVRYENALITVGQIKSADNRKRLYNIIKTLDINLPVIIANSSIVSKYSSICDGSIIMNGAFVNAGASVGRNVIINSMALIEHDVQIGDHCHISTGARINGGVTIGDESFIGSGSIIHEGVSVGKNVVIGAGTVIAKNVDDAKIIRV